MREACLVLVAFILFVVNYDMSVCDVFPSLGRHVRLVNEEDDVSSLDNIQDSLGEAFKFLVAGVFYRGFYILNCS